MTSQRASGQAADNQERARRMAVLAIAEPGEMTRLWETLEIDPAFSLLRGPETGLVTVRGRIGGGGSPFNVGETTVTRATVRLDDGIVGHAWMLGRDHTKATLAAVIDAVAMRPGMAGAVEEAVIAPLERLAKEADLRLAEETAATKVDFFTMVRGED